MLNGNRIASIKGNGIIESVIEAARLLALTLLVC